MKFSDGLNTMKLIFVFIIINIIELSAFLKGANVF